MAYTKFLVDNPTCQRRFHLSYDDQDDKVAHTEVKCSFCDVTIFAADQHPPVKLARQENLVRTVVLAENLVYECNFHDTLTEKTVKDWAPKKLYKDSSEPKSS